MTGGLAAHGSGKGETWPASNTTLHFLLILLVGVACYANTLQVPFVLDDRTSIVENHLIKDLPGFFADFAGLAHNPRRFIGYLTFALNYRFGGLHVRGYHLFNTGVHLSTALLVYCFCSLTFRTPLMRTSRLVHMSPFIGLGAALLFVAHPLQTQAVTYLSQRVASLATMLYLLAMTLYAMARLALERSDHGPDLRAGTLFLGAFLSMVLAMMTKETAFTLPILLVLYEFSFFGGSIRKRTAIFLPVLLALALIPLAMLHTNQSLGNLPAELDAKLNAATGISRTDYLLTQFCVVTTYLRLLLLPINQNLDYAYPVYHTFFTPRVLASFIFLAGLPATAAVLFVRARRGADPALRLVSFGIFWFFIALAVESSVIPIADVIFEHRLYLPSVGVFIGVATLLALVTSRHGAGLFLTLVFVATTILAVATWQRNRIWSDEVALWQDTVRKSPGKDRPRNNLGKALLQKGRLDEAIRETEIALALNPGNGEAWSNLGATYLKKGDSEKAKDHLQTAVKLNPGNYAARYNLGLALSNTGRIDRAAAEFLAAVQLNPDSAGAHNHLAIACAALQMPEAAVEHFREAVRLGPDKAEYKRNLELALETQ